MICTTAVARAVSPLEQALLSAVREAQFDRVIDFGPANEDRNISPGSAKRIAQVPNVDLAVIEFDAQGRAVACANVLLSRDYPRGLVVPVDWHAGAASVRFRRWDIERWNGGKFKPGDAIPETIKGWTNHPPLSGADDIVPGRTHAPHQFMAPYPASLFKLLVAFHTMRMVDAGVITLDAPCTYSAPGKADEKRSVRDWLDPMITVSDNHATHALLQMLHRHGRMDVMNREFRELGLGTLQVNGTRAEDGYGWQTDRIHMTAFDTARLLWLIEAPAGELWRAPDGKMVKASYLADSSRAQLKRLLLEQGLNEALSNANLAGMPQVRPGIPSQIAARWINPTSGCVVVGGINFGVDVRSSNARAEVTFAHKTGLTYNYASDAGIVTSLPGKPFRHYIVVFLSNLGYRYVDDAFANRTRGPHADPVSPIGYTQRIPALGRAIDGAVQRLSAAQKP
jgi:beta-lactamase class A